MFIIVVVDYFRLSQKTIVKNEVFVAVAIRENNNLICKHILILHYPCNR